MGTGRPNRPPSAGQPGNAFSREGRERDEQERERESEQPTFKQPFTRSFLSFSRSFDDELGKEGKEEEEDGEVYTHKNRPMYTVLRFHRNTRAFF